MAKSLFLLVPLAVACLASSAYAGQLSSGFVYGERDTLHPVLSSSGRIRYVYRNANSCAPDLPMAVWGRGADAGKLLGYRCYENSNG